MFLNEANVTSITKKQYLFKLKANYGIFSSLLLTQVFGFLFSINGSGQSGGGFNEWSIYANYYNSNLIIMFTMLWAFITGVSISSKQSRDGDFSFVSNRLSSNLSNIAFLLTASVVGGLAAMLSGSLLKVIVYYVFGPEKLIFDSFAVPPLQLFIGVVVTILYVGLFAAAGYVVGNLVQLSKLFVFLLLGLLFGGLFIEASTNGSGYLAFIVKFFGMETSFFIFTIKALIVIGLLFAAAIGLSDRMEVRR